MCKKILYILTTVITLFAIAGVYYNYPRKVPFELVKEIDKPAPEFERSYYGGFNYVNSTELLKYWMVDYYRKPSCISAGLNGYSKEYVEELAGELDFTKYDYLITYQKELKALRHSPYLTNNDTAYFDKRTVLIPTWDEEITDKVYIYRIKKNKRFRAPGP